LDDAKSTPATARSNEAGFVFDSKVFDPDWLDRDIASRLDVWLHFKQVDALRN